jgi:hypothetical protein
VRLTIGAYGLRTNEGSTDYQNVDATATLLPCLRKVFIVILLTLDGAGVKSKLLISLPEECSHNTPIDSLPHSLAFITCIVVCSLQIPL